MIKDRLLKLLRLIKRKITAILLFSYGILFGTFSPFLLSGCGTNCGNCGYCGLFLGILPLVLFVILKSKLLNGGRQLISLARANRAKGGIRS